jgi:transcription initiation factor TFIID subunit 7
MATPGGDIGEGDEDDEADEQSDAEPDGDIDEELAAELDQALGDDLDENAGDDEDEDEDESEEDDDDDEDDEDVQARQLLNEEIRDLEAAVAKKQAEVASSSNPLIRVCAHLQLSLSCIMTDLLCRNDSKMH